MEDEFDTVILESSISIVDETLDVGVVVVSVTSFTEDGFLARCILSFEIGVA